MYCPGAEHNLELLIRTAVHQKDRVTNLSVQKQSGGLAVPGNRGRGVWKWAGISILLVVIVLTVVAEMMMHRAAPILKGRVIDTLSARFKGRVEMDGLNVSLLRGLQV